MKSRIVAIGSWLFLSAIYACGGDDSAPPETDAGIDGGENVSGSGGKGGKGGSGGGGQGGTGGNDNGGSGGQGGTGGDDGNGGNSHRIGGEVSGLNGSGLVLELNEGNALDISENGDFWFDKKLDKDADYTVMVKTQPSSPTQACSVKDGSGKVAESDVDNIKIECSNVTRSVGGNVSGLGGGEIKLKNNGGDELTVQADGNFTFQTALQIGAAYAVTVSSAPSGRTCSLTKGTGTLAANNVTDVNIVCYAGLTLAARARVGSVELSWAGNSATSYTVHRSTANCNFDDPNSCADHAQQENVTSPYIWTGLTNGTVYYFNIRGKHPDNFETRSTNTSGARPNSAELDGPVTALARGADGTIYVGGQFQSVGPYTGPLAPLDKTTGRSSRIPSFPIFGFSGSPVSTVLSDGNHGYFVGGTFALAAGDTTINNLVHVLASGAIDTTWKPEPTGGNVGEIVRVGTTLYLIGSFTTVGGQARKGIAAVSAEGAGAVSSWDPNPTPTGSVNALVANDTTVYVGGDFTNIGGQPRNYLASLNTGNGNAVSGFDPNPNLAVVSLALASDALYVAGSFNTIGGGSHTRLAALNLTTGVALAFDATPTANNPPNTMAVSGDVLYVGGNFTDISTTERNRLAALNRTTGALTDWNPGADDDVQALTVSGDNIYVAGDFTKIGTTTRKYLAAINKQGALQDWDPQPGAPLTGLAADDDTIYAFGTTTRSFGVEPHVQLAAFKDGALTTWGPAVTGGDVLALAASGETIYVGGDFTTVGGSARAAAAAISNAGALRDWNAQLTEEGVPVVRAIVVDNNRVYLGGGFDHAGGSARKNLAALTGDTAATLSGWTLTGAAGGGGIYALALDGSDLYFGGGFTSVATSNMRARLAKVNADTGAISSWDPGANGLVRALTVIGSNVIAGGDFTQLDSSAHARLGAVDTTTGDADNTWNLTLDDSALALAKVDNVLYVGGDFENIGAQPADAALHFAVFQYDEGAFTRVTSAFGVSGSISALAVDTGNVYLGGNTLTAEGTSCRYFCARERTLPPP